MGGKVSDEICLENYRKLQELFNKIVPDASRFVVVYACGVDVGMMDYVVVRKTTYTYASYIIGFDTSGVELVILPIDRDLDSYSDPIYMKHTDIVNAKMGWLSKEITVRDERLPKKYIQFSVPEYINEDDDKVVVCVKQKEQYKQFMDFFKNQFAKK